MNHAVARLDVNRHHFGGTNHHTVVFFLDIERIAANGFDNVIAVSDLRRHQICRHHMVGQDGFELIEVLGLQQGFDRACRQCSKSGVSRSEHRKGSVTAQHVLQTSGLDGSDQSGEVAGSGSFVDTFFATVFCSCII